MSLAPRCLRFALITSRACPGRYVTTTTNTTTSETWSGRSFDGTETVETYVSSEIHKVNVVRQKEVSSSDGTPKKVTIPPTLWDEDYGSASEAIVKAEKGIEGALPSFQEMQATTIKTIKHKESQTTQKQT